MVPGNNAFPVHPILHRSLTPREAARLQTFPDDFVFAGDRRNQCILVGNAVPSLFAEAIGRSIIQHAKSRAEPKASMPAATLPSPKAKTVKPLPAEHATGFVDLFCGAGGITIGLERAGWTPLLGVDLNVCASATHRRNFPHVPHLEEDPSQPAVLDEVVSSAAGKEVGNPCRRAALSGVFHLWQPAVREHTWVRSPQGPATGWCSHSSRRFEGYGHAGS